MDVRSTEKRRRKSFHGKEVDVPKREVKWIWHEGEEEKGLKEKEGDMD